MHRFGSAIRAILVGALVVDSHLSSDGSENYSNPVEIFAGKKPGSQSLFPKSKVTRFDFRKTFASDTHALVPRVLSSQLTDWTTHPFSNFFS